MPVATTQATYKGGIVIPKDKPPFGAPDEVIVSYVKIANGKTPKTAGNSQVILAVLKQYRGILPKRISSGKIYISRLRKKMSAEWERAITK